MDDKDIAAVVKAIKFLAECRDTHVWAEDTIVNGMGENVLAGDETFHAQCVNEYQEVMDLLIKVVKKNLERM